MKPKTTQALCTLLTGLFLSSCGSIYYAPNQPHMPMVKDKGVTKVNTSIGSGEVSSAFELNAFHSVSNHAGMLGNFTSMSLDGNSLNTFDFGGGYFHAIDESSGFEIYSTLGFGDLQLNEYDWWTGQTTRTGSTSVFRASLQPDIFYAGKNVEVGLGVRLHYFSFGDLPSEYTYNSGNYYETTPIASKKHLMLEPTLKLGFGGQKVKATIQGTYSNKINSGYLRYDNLVISIGISMKFGMPNGQHHPGGNYRKQPDIIRE